MQTLKHHVQSVFSKATSRFSSVPFHFTPRITLTFPHSNIELPPLSFTPLLLHSTCLHPRMPTFLHVYAPQVYVHHQLTYVSFGRMVHEWSLKMEPYQGVWMKRSVSYSMVSLMSLYLWRSIVLSGVLLTLFFMLPFYVEWETTLYLLAYSFFMLVSLALIPTHLETWNTSVFLHHCSLFFFHLPVSKVHSWIEPCVLEWVNNGQMQVMACKSKELKK
ncbi:hypothetical protein HMI54_004399 [Coelomomyces lativittatus]|nr:hypothetical protein HMI56_001657 [Coelomomyces lativittatus]KAJ1507178.1 hypothetical protein HMI54_004399 [Coelomomyces lativittatus]KAJ1509226.1 hypothetical protein HMI55_000056 [Coelomomyces lativittatus]